MSKNTEAIHEDLSAIADDARALIAATADLGGEKVAEARQRLTAALERGKEMCGRAREKALEGARAADVAVHAHPYQAMGIALGVGALLGFLMSHRCACNRG